MLQEPNDGQQAWNQDFETPSQNLLLVSPSQRNRRGVNHFSKQTVGLHDDAGQGPFEGILQAQMEDNSPFHNKDINSESNMAHAMDENVSSVRNDQLIMIQTSGSSRRAIESVSFSSDMESRYDY